MSEDDVGKGRPAGPRHVAVRRLLSGAALLMLTTCIARVGFISFIAARAWEEAAQSATLVFLLRFGENRHIASTEVLLGIILGSTVGALGAFLRSCSATVLAISVAMLLIHHPCPTKSQSTIDAIATPSLSFWQLLLAAFWLVYRSAAGSSLDRCFVAAFTHVVLLVAAAELVALLSLPHRNGGGGGGPTGGLAPGEAVAELPAEEGGAAGGCTQGIGGGRRGGGAAHGSGPSIGLDVGALPPPPPPLSPTAVPASAAVASPVFRNGGGAAAAASMGRYSAAPSPKHHQQQQHGLTVLPPPEWRSGVYSPLMMRGGAFCPVTTAAGSLGLDSSGGSPRRRRRSAGPPITGESSEHERAQLLLQQLAHHGDGVGGGSDGNGKGCDPVIATRASCPVVPYARRSGAPFLLRSASSAAINALKSSRNRRGDSAAAAGDIASAIAAATAAVAVAGYQPSVFTLASDSPCRWSPGRSRAAGQPPTAYVATSGNDADAAGRVETGGGEQPAAAVELVSRPSDGPDGLDGQSPSKAQRQEPLHREQALGQLEEEVGEQEGRKAEGERRKKDLEGGESGRADGSGLGCERGRGGGGHGVSGDGVVTSRVGRSGSRDRLLKEEERSMAAAAAALGTEDAGGQTAPPPPPQQQQRQESRWTPNAEEGAAAAATGLRVGETNLRVVLSNDGRQQQQQQCIRYRRETTGGGTTSACDYIMLESTLPGTDGCAERYSNDFSSDDDDGCGGGEDDHGDGDDGDDPEDESSPYIDEYDMADDGDSDSDDCFSLVIANGDEAPLEDGMVGGVNRRTHGSQRPQDAPAAAAAAADAGADADPGACAVEGGVGAPSRPRKLGTRNRRCTVGGLTAAHRDTRHANDAAGAAAAVTMADGRPPAGPSLPPQPRWGPHYPFTLQPLILDPYGCDVADLADLEDLMSLEEAAAGVASAAAASGAMATAGPTPTATAVSTPVGGRWPAASTGVCGMSEDMYCCSSNWGAPRYSVLAAGSEPRRNAAQQQQHWLKNKPQMDGLRQHSGGSGAGGGGGGGDGPGPRAGNGAAGSGGGGGGTASWAVASAGQLLGAMRRVERSGGSGGGNGPHLEQQLQEQDEHQQQQSSGAVVELQPGFVPLQEKTLAQHLAGIRAQDFERKLQLQQELQQLHQQLLRQRYWQQQQLPEQWQSGTDGVAEMEEAPAAGGGGDGAGGDEGDGEPHLRTSFPSAASPELLICFLREVQVRTGDRDHGYEGCCRTGSPSSDDNDEDEDDDGEDEGKVVPCSMEGAGPWRSPGTQLEPPTSGAVVAAGPAPAVAPATASASAAVKGNRLDGWHCRRRHHRYDPHHHNHLDHARRHHHQYADGQLCRKGVSPRVRQNASATYPGVPSLSTSLSHSGYVTLPSVEPKLAAAGPNPGIGPNWQQPRGLGPDARPQPPPALPSYEQQGSYEHQHHRRKPVLEAGEAADGDGGGGRSCWRQQRRPERVNLRRHHVRQLSAGQLHARWLYGQEYVYGHGQGYGFRDEDGRLEDYPLSQAFAHELLPRPCQAIQGHGDVDGQSQSPHHLARRGGQMRERRVVGADADVPGHVDEDVDGTAAAAMAWSPPPEAKAGGFACVACKGGRASADYTLLLQQAAHHHHQKQQLQQRLSLDAAKAAAKAVAATLTTPLRAAASPAAAADGGSGGGVTAEVTAFPVEPNLPLVDSLVFELHGHALCEHHHLQQLQQQQQQQQQGRLGEGGIRSSAPAHRGVLQAAYSPARINGRVATACRTSTPVMVSETTGGAWTASTAGATTAGGFPSPMWHNIVCRTGFSWGGDGGGTGGKGSCVDGGGNAVRSMVSLGSPQSGHGAAAAAAAVAVPPGAASAPSTPPTMMVVEPFSAADQSVYRSLSGSRRHEEFDRRLGISGNYKAALAAAAAAAGLGSCRSRPTTPPGAAKPPASPPPPSPAAAAAAAVEAAPMSEALPLTAELGAPADGVYGSGGGSVLDGLNHHAAAASRTDLALALPYASSTPPVVLPAASAAGLTAAAPSGYSSDRTQLSEKAKLTLVVSANPNHASGDGGGGGVISAAAVRLLPSREQVSEAAVAATTATVISASAAAEGSEAEEEEEGRCQKQAV